MKRMKIVVMLLPILLLGAAGVGTSYVFTKLAGEEPQLQQGSTTRFYVINDGEISLGKPALFRVIVENHEGKAVDYWLKVRQSGEVIHSQEIKLNHDNSLNQTISFIPDQAEEDYSKIEFLLYKANEIYTTRVFQISSDTNSPVKVDKTQETKKINVIGEKKMDAYTKQESGDDILFAFNTGEELRLRVSNGKVNKGDAVYTAAGKESKIVFLGETYEKILISNAIYLYPIIMEMNGKKLKIKETMELKNGYSFTLKEIDGQSLKTEISKDGRIVREVLSKGNAPIEYWKEINEYKKQKMIQIIPEEINQNEGIFYITQYGDQKAVLVGNKYGEFKVLDVSSESITLENIQPITIEAGKDISLMNGKIKIKV